MTRRKNNLLEDVIERLSRLPWWAGVFAAALSWAGFYALTHAAGPVKGGDLTPLQQIALPAVRDLAKVAQVLLPLLFCAAGFYSGWLQYRHQRNYAGVSGEQGAFLLQTLSGREFENLVAEFFRRKGFTVELRSRRHPEDGVDLTASIGEDCYLVQCKHWRVQRVGVAVVRDLVEIAESEQAAGVFVVTSGSFTDEARRFVEKNRIAIELITGEQLRRMIRGLEPAAQSA